MRTKFNQILTIDDTTVTVNRNETFYLLKAPSKPNFPLPSDPSHFCSATAEVTEKD